MRNAQGGGYVRLNESDLYRSNTDQIYKCTSYRTIKFQRKTRESPHVRQKPVRNFDVMPPIPPYFAPKLICTAPCLIRKVVKMPVWEVRSPTFDYGNADIMCKCRFHFEVIDKSDKHDN